MSVPRINIFKLIKGFYAWLFEHQEMRVTAAHVSLYFFIVHQNNLYNWVEWIKIPLELAMNGACIGSKRTYYKCLNDLKDWKLIEYQKGRGNYMPIKIKIVKFKKEPYPVTYGTPYDEPCDEPNAGNCDGNIIKTKDNKLKTNNNIDDEKKGIIDFSRKHLMKVSEEMLASTKDKICLQLAKEFYRIQEQKSSDRGKTWSHLKNAQYEAWTKPVALLMDKDDYSRAEIETVLNFLREDEFWWDKVRTTAKLRQKDKQGTPYVEVLLNHTPKNLKINKTNNYENTKRNLINDIAKLS